MGPDTYATELAKRCKKAFEIVCLNTSRHLEYRQLSYKETPDLELNSRVLVFMPRKYKNVSTKLLNGFSLPFRVIRKLSYCIYEVKSEEWSKTPIILQRSITFLKKFPSNREFQYQGNTNLKKVTSILVMNLRKLILTCLAPKYLVECSVVPDLVR